jgi:hypothetical protein
VEFALRNLSVLAYANGFTLWHYKAAADAHEAAGASGFFNRAGDMLAAGDIIMVSSPRGGGMLCVLPDENGVRTARLA